MVKVVGDFGGPSVRRSVIPQRSGRRATTLTLVIVISIAFAMCIGNASAQTETKTGAKSHPVPGFLGDYSGLSQAQNNRDLLLYVKEKGILKNYDKFMVDEVSVQLLSEAKERNLDPDDQALIDELQKSGRYTVVDYPAPECFTCVLL